MEASDIVFINTSECVRCWRCVRHCPVKAIDACDRGARVDPDRCIHCGQCLDACRYGAVILRDDILSAKSLIKRHTVKVASVSPQWTTQMDGISEGKLVEALGLLGFTHASESALAAEATLSKETELSRLEGRQVISSRCGAVVRYVEKYSPRHLELLSPLATPMTVHARMIKSWWGNSAAIVHFSACPAAKAEAAEKDCPVDAVLTFGELKKWMRGEGIEVSNLFAGSERRFEPFAAKKGNRYTLCGETGYGSADDGDVFFESPVESVAQTLRHFRKGEGPLWIDFMACKGGCEGSGAASCRSVWPMSKNLRLKHFSRQREKLDEYYNLPCIPLERERVPQAPRDGFVAESRTMESLAELGMPNKSLESDCDACGYGTCRRFAKALSRGEVPRELCWFYLHDGVTTKLDTLLSKLSSGVAIVDSSMKIEHANRNMASVIGPETEALFDSRKTGLAGASATDTFPFHELVASVLETGEESLVRDVQIREKLITVSVHTVRKNRLVLVICRNMIFSQVRNEEIVKRTQKVIDENLDTVRRIALLLGENASRTEAILNSILEAHTRENG